MGNTKRAHEVLSDEELERICQFAKGKGTPLLILNLEKIRMKYREIATSMPRAKVYFAMKACPNDEVLTMLYQEGSYFDVASVYEIDQLLRLGIPAQRLSYGNPIKKAVDIAYGYQKGIRLFTSDSYSDLEKLAANAPGAMVNLRLLLDGSGADWPLSKKFGAHPDMVYKLMKKAKELGLEPYGIAFHVGSQQRDIGQWDSAIALVRYLFDALKADGIQLRCINLGGGFPAHYLKPTKEVPEYAKNIIRYIEEDFPANHLDLIIEPGRSMTGDAGVIVSEVVMISRKSDNDDTRWVFIDIGKFGGLIETLDEAIKYPILVEGRYDDGDHTGKSEVILAGPTCDSADILYENYKYKLPDDLKEGDRLLILTTGAYTMSYSAVSFNGFPPLRLEVMK